MKIRMAKQEEYEQLAEMKWLHCKEDEVDYNEKILDGVNKDDFVKEFVDFFINNKEYLIFIAQEDDVVVSGMFVYMIPKTPKPGRCPKFIAYLTNVYTRKEYRNKQIGTELLTYIKEYLKEKNCEMLFAWPSENSVPWYVRNDFTNENEIFQCDL